MDVQKQQQQVAQVTALTKEAERVQAAHRDLEDGDHGAGPWANYTGPRAPAEAAAARPWPSAAAAASPSVGTTPWAAALPQNACAASVSQPAAAAAAAVAVGGRKPLYDLGGDLQPQWQCQDEHGSWIDYAAAFNTTLETAYQDGQELIRYKPGKAVDFVYYLESFVQENQETLRRRTMRRMLIQRLMQRSLESIKKNCDEHNAINHTLDQAHRRTRPDARSRSASRTRSQAGSSS